MLEEENNVVVEGQLMGFNERELKTDAIILSILVADETDGLTCKMRFADPGGKNDLKKNQKECADLKAKLPVGCRVKIQGDVAPDKYENFEIVMLRVKNIMMEPAQKREDKAEVKRVELHCHTKMSKMDGLTPIEELVKTAIRWGHKALAITDHGVVQAFPFAYDAAAGSDLKLIFGLEGYLCHHLKDKKNYHIILLAKMQRGCGTCTGWFPVPFAVLWQPAQTAPDDQGLLDQPGRADYWLRLRCRGSVPGGAGRGGPSGTVRHCVLL